MLSSGTCLHTCMLLSCLWLSCGGGSLLRDNLVDVPLLYLLKQRANLLDDVAIVTERQIYFSSVSNHFDRVWTKQCWSGYFCSSPVTAVNYTWIHELITLNSHLFIFSHNFPKHDVLCTYNEQSCTQFKNIHKASTWSVNLTPCGARRHSGWVVLLSARC